MLNGLYKVVATAVQEHRRQASIARNMHGSQLPGYRREMLRLLGSSDASASGQGKAETLTLHQQAGIRTTGDATDFALSGPGFFVVNRSDGQQMLTRNGDFQIDPNGQLVTGEGHLVAGTNGPLTVPPDVPRERLAVDETGTLFAESADGRRPLGQLLLGEVADPQQLNRLSANYFAVPGTGYQPAAATQLQHRALELSNVSPLLEMTTMVESMREFEAAHTMLKMTDELLKKRLNP